MQADIARDPLQRFRAGLARHTGLHFDDAKFGLLHDVLERRLSRLGCASAYYLSMLDGAPAQAELAALAQDLTVGETYFFRHADQFRALAEVALPERMRAREQTRRLHLLSAGCASGEEAYSLAVVARETVADPAWDVAIRAIDLNPAALAKAKLARYSAWALRDTPAEQKRKWFRADDRVLVLDPTVRDAVTFGLGNLATDDAALAQPGLYDVIFCRNVLMYFTPEQMRASVARLAAALAPGGYLFLGHAETLRGMSEEFHLCHSHGTFYYRRNGQGPGTDVANAPVVNGDIAHDPVVRGPQPAISIAWVETIRQASDRVTSLTSAATRHPAKPARRGRAWELAPALELLHQERFGEALDFIATAPTDAEGDSDVLVVKAVLLIHCGRLAEAEAACRRCLQTDERHAGAHYVLALCGEQAGMPERAMEHNRIAARFDPGFAMPRLHGGLLARRMGDRDGARRELAQALILLKREDASRLRLFGGGFSRDALIAFCRAVVAECAGKQ
jgi:chemotaxis protein methyltransferase CheR